MLFLFSYKSFFYILVIFFEESIHQEVQEEKEKEMEIKKVC
jgi:hypothetical protein